MVFVVTQAFGAIFTHDDIKHLKHHFLANIKPNGAIVASPSQYEPNYYYDWVRDSAIAMGLIERWYEENHHPKYLTLLENYVHWTRLIQHQYDPLGENILGEPKFYIDGYPFEGAWGRPQNDGPAIRASVLTRFANDLLNQNKGQYVANYLYKPSMDPNLMGAIKLDLEYIAHHWEDANFDLWEEVYGHHFFTAMAQQKALIEGAALAERLHDEGAGNFYRQQAFLLERRLQQHLDPRSNSIKATLTPHPGPQKAMELDTSIILGLLMNPHSEGAFSLDHYYVKNTIDLLHQQFNLMFPINDNASGAILFGRYPGDTYDGYHTNSIGNPWFILTATMAEYYYAIAQTTEEKALAHKYLKTGDEYLKLIKHYAPDMYLDEQINLNSGIQQGAKSLTWSYVSVLKAIELREKLDN